MCLSCGERLQLGGPNRQVAALAALAAVVVLGAGVVGFALSELTGGSESDGAVGAERGGEANPGTQPARPEAKTETVPETEPAPRAEGNPQPPRQSLLLEWPRNLTAHTVVLVTTSDRAGARRVALGAARSGIETGLLRSDDYDLGTGLWIVFAGRFDTRRGALRQAQNLAGRYPGAYVQLVKPVN